VNRALRFTLLGLAVVLIAGVSLSLASQPGEAAQVKTLWCRGETARDERLFRGERPPAFISVDAVPASQRGRFRAFVFGEVHVIAPRNWFGCTGSGSSAFTHIHVAGGKITDLAQVVAVRGSP
jgi:hypothetical protein